MNNTPLFKPSRRTEVQLTTDQMVINILTITTIGLVVIAGAVAIPGDVPIVVWGLAISAFFSLGATLLAKRGITTPGRILVPGLLTLVAAFIAYNRGGLYHIAVAGFPVIIIMAGLLLGKRGSFVFASLASLAAIFIGFADINGISPLSSNSRTGYDDIGVAVVLFFMTAGVLRLIIQRLTESLREVEANAQTQKEVNLELQQLQIELEQHVDQRTAELQEKVAQLQTISQVSQTISGIQNLDELLSRVADLISERFSIYHTGIFLVDEKGEYAILQAANSAGGQNMLARGHRLRVGTQGIVGYATSTGRARIALDVGEDAVYFDNPDLPDTHSEIALPLIIAGQTFGALDLQSTQPNAFGNEDIQTLSILADQVAIAIQNARSFEQSREAVQATEAAHRQMTGQAWQQYTAQGKVLGFEYDGSTAKPITKTLKDDTSLDIPLKLRGHTIGKLKLSAVDPGHNWTEDEIALARAAAERTALTLESARLLEDAQLRASRERVIGDISASISTFSDMEGILRTAVQQLGRRMGGAEVVLELGSDLETEENTE